MRSLRFYTCPARDSRGVRLAEKYGGCNLMNTSCSSVTRIESDLPLRVVIFTHLSAVKMERLLKAEHAYKNRSFVRIERLQMKQ